MARTGTSIQRSWSLTGKLRDKVLVRGKTEVHLEGCYYIEWWLEGARKRGQITDRLEVVYRARRKAIELTANRAGIETVQEIGRGHRPTVAEAVSSYLEDMKPPQREPKTYIAYKYCLELFASNCAKRFVQDVKREDLLAFIRKLYELGCGPRTAGTYRSLCTFPFLAAHNVVVAFAIIPVGHRIGFPPSTNK